MNIFSMIFLFWRRWILAFAILFIISPRLDQKQMAMGFLFSSRDSQSSMRRIEPFLRHLRRKTNAIPPYKDRCVNVKLYADDDTGNDGSSILFKKKEVRFEIEIGDVTEMVKLSNIDDAPQEAQRIHQKHGWGEDPSVQMLEEILYQYWNDVISCEGGYGLEPVPYAGPNSPQIRSDSPIVLPSGLVLEVLNSTIPDAGMGVFVRKNNTSDDGILQLAGSAFCGYAKGTMKSTISISEQRSGIVIEFRLDDGLESLVWYDGALMPVKKALFVSKANGITGHKIIFKSQVKNEVDTDVFGDNVSLKDSADEIKPTTRQQQMMVDLVFDETLYKSNRYFVPESKQQETFTIRTIGKMMNDLAGGCDSDDKTYETDSEGKNLLVIVPRVRAVTHKNSDDNITLLEPYGMPIFTLARSVLITNEEPMEVGCNYGFNYWQEYCSSNNAIGIT
mmetsp:Transcript_3233/g.4812  ORF Transcript_3233/g.4812 Transcript_3233/m.4812 type:complete len:447 (+) Transcript_3233:50-1390(+)